MAMSKIVGNELIPKNMAARVDNLSSKLVGNYIINYGMYGSFGSGVNIDIWKSLSPFSYSFV